MFNSPTEAATGLTALGPDHRNYLTRTMHGWDCFEENRWILVVFVALVVVVIVLAGLHVYYSRLLPRQCRRKRTNKEETEFEEVVVSAPNANKGRADHGAQGLQAGASFPNAGDNRYVVAQQEKDKLLSENRELGVRADHGAQELQEVASFPNDNDNRADHGAQKLQEVASFPNDNDNRFVMAQQEIRSLKQEKEKLQSEERELGTRFGQAQDQIRALQQENEKLLSEKRRLRVRFEEDQQHIHALEQDKKKIQAENEELLTRLSGFASDRMRENNPNIQDLSDQYRPTKLAEMSSELYDNEWTEAFDVLEQNGKDETRAIRILLDIVMLTYEVCRGRADQQWKEIINLIGESDETTSLQVKRALQDGRKKKAWQSSPDLKKKISDTLNRQIGARFITTGPVQTYVDKCVTLCCHMAVQSPPVVWYCPGWSKRQDNAATVARTENSPKNKFDKKLFREYMKSGPFVNYIVWPAMLLHDAGSTLNKGVAQGCS